MQELIGTYKAGDGKDYFYVALNIKTGEKVLIKNAGCEAAAIDMAAKHWDLNYYLYSSSGIRIFFLGTSKEIDLNRIPKKYHKYFN